MAISTRGIFILKVGEAKSGMRIYAFFRWVNAINEAMNSGWSNARYTVVV